MMTNLGGFPINFDDSHKQKDPGFDELAEGCFSHAGEITLKHKTRRARGLCFTTTNEEKMNRADDADFSRYKQLIWSDSFKIKDREARHPYFTALRAFASHFPRSLQLVVIALYNYANISNRNRLSSIVWKHLEKVFPDDDLDQIIPSLSTLHF